MVASDFSFQRGLLLCLFFLVKGQQLCVALALLLDGCLGSYFCLQLPADISIRMKKKI